MHCERGLAAAIVLALAATAPGPATAQSKDSIGPAAAATLELPRPTGPHRVGRTELHLVDEGRQDPFETSKPRELMISVWYPAAPTAAAGGAAYIASGAGKLVAEALLKPMGVEPARLDLSAIRTHASAEAAPAKGRYPVVLYSPGGGFSRSFGTVLVEDLASRGYVVVTIDHTYEALAVEFPDGRVVARAMPKGEGVLQRTIAARVADARFVLSALEGSVGRRLPNGLASRMDFSRVGMFGHSAGGFTALQAMAQDRRIDAAANLDGSLAYSMSKSIYGEVVEQGLNRPFLLMGAGVSGKERRPHTHQWAPDWHRLWARSAGWKRDLYIEKGEHLSFSDHAALLPAIARAVKLPPLVTSSALGAADPARVIAIERAYLAAFFDQHLKGKRQPLLDAASPLHPEATFVN